ncbi:MAG: hypothetical protein JXD23_05065 [Spirochaetales bacterium]|nr:hypothetical protein [Spirochaetales bacterium]
MILACDIGTSSLKLGVIDITGSLRAFMGEPVAQASAAAWRRAFLRAVRAVPDDLKRSLRAVCVSGHSPTLVPIDKRGLPAAAPLMWFEGTPRVPSETPAGSYFLPKVKRFAADDPRSYARTDRFLPTGEYLSFLLTGNKTAFIPHEGFESYYWSGESIAECGLEKSKFPRLTLVGNPAGEVTARAAESSGIPVKTPVFCGGADFLMAILGSNALTPGLANDRGGTCEALNYCGGKAYSSPLLRPVPGFSAGTWNIGGFIPFAGRLHAWLKEKLIGRNGSFEEFAALADEIDPGSNTVRFSPPLSVLSKLNSHIPLSSAYKGASGETSRGEYALTFFEYIGFSLRRIIAEIEKLGLDVHAVHSSGGLAKNTRLSRLKATVTGKKVRIPAIEDCELIGNASVAFTGLGEYRTMEEAARTLARFKAEYDPDPAWSAFYDDRFAALTPPGGRSPGGGEHD